MQRGKTYLVMVHVAGWLLFMVLPLLFLNVGEQTHIQLLALKSPYYWLFCFTYIFLFYINVGILIPAFFFKKAYFKYALITIILFTGVYFLRPYDRLLRSSEVRNRFSFYQGYPPMFNHPQGSNTPFRPNEPRPFEDQPDRRPPSNFPGGEPGYFGPGFAHFGMPGHHIDNISLFLFVMVMALSTAVKINRQWEITEQRATQAEADKASAELSFLKAQINPHFLFNTLNNIYTLAVIKDDHAPDSIMKLSNIMRYVTDDTNADFVPLQSELDCINDYIELQRLRLGEKTKVDILIAGLVEEKKIAPLVLMTFIENIFKYGISKHENTVIVINVLATEYSIRFFCENSIFNDNKQNQRKGIGILNTRKRLQHLYPGKHTLDINIGDELFTVNLTLLT